MLNRFARQGRYLADRLLSGVHGSEEAVRPSAKEVRDWVAKAVAVRRELNQMDLEFGEEHRRARNRITAEGVVVTTTHTDEPPVGAKVVLGAPPATHTGRLDRFGLRDAGSRREGGTREYEWLVELATKGLRERDNHPMPESVTTPEAFYDVMARAALDAIGLAAILEEAARAEREPKTNDEAQTQAVDEPAVAATTVPGMPAVSTPLVLTSPPAPPNRGEDRHGVLDAGGRPARGSTDYEWLVEPPTGPPQRHNHPMPESVTATNASDDVIARATPEVLVLAATLEDVVRAKGGPILADETLTKVTQGSAEAATTHPGEPPYVRSALPATAGGREDGLGVHETVNRRGRGIRKAKNARLRR